MKYMLVIILFFVANRTIGEVTTIQTGDTFTITFSSTFIKNGELHRDNLRVASRLWAVCRPLTDAELTQRQEDFRLQQEGAKVLRAGKQPEDCRHGYLYRPIRICDEELVKTQGCSPFQIGQEVEESRSLDWWINRLLQNVLRVTTKDGKDRWTNALVIPNGSLPVDMRDDMDTYLKTEEEPSK